jgi:hypothetical protein
MNILPNDIEISLLRYLNSESILSFFLISKKSNKLTKKYKKVYKYHRYFETIFRIFRESRHYRYPIIYYKLKGQ